jgi:hypothetical protein
MHTYLDCIPCFVRQALAAARAATPDPAIQRHAVNAVAYRIPDLPLTVCPPEIAQKIYRIVGEVTGDHDPYHDEKARINTAVLSRQDYLEDLIEQSANPLKMACQLAIAGNTIDLGPSDQLDTVDSVIKEGIGYRIGREAFGAFEAGVRKASRIVYLADNAGEIVFDRLVIEQIMTCSRAEIVLVVKEKPVINDATLSDARAAGLTRLVTVISNGTDAPGTLLPQCSEFMRARYHAADLIIAKGQANFESLNTRTENVFFLLKVKCPVIARSSGRAVGEPVLCSRRRSPFRAAAAGR